MAKDTTNWELPRISMNYLNHQSRGKLTIKHGIYVMGISKWLVDFPAISHTKLDSQVTHGIHRGIMGVHSTILVFLS
jgi:hypothetical protein